MKINWKDDFKTVVLNIISNIIDRAILALVGIIMVILFKPDIINPRTIGVDSSERIESPKENKLFQESNDKDIVQIDQNDKPVYFEYDPEKHAPLLETPKKEVKRSYNYWPDFLKTRLKYDGSFFPLSEDGFNALFAYYHITMWDYTTRLERVMGILSGLLFNLIILFFLLKSSQGRADISSSLSIISFVFMPLLNILFYFIISSTNGASGFLLWVWHGFNWPMLVGGLIAFIWIFVDGILWIYRLGKFPF